METMPLQVLNAGFPGILTSFVQHVIGTSTMVTSQKLWTFYLCIVLNH